MKFVLDIADALWEECKVSAQQGTELDTGRQPANTESAHTDDDIEQKVEEYRRRLILEKNQEGASSSSGRGNIETA